MQNIAYVLRKQKQLLEIELGELKTSQVFGHPTIHPENYYVKLAHSHHFLEKAIKLIETTEEDIYNNKYLQQ